MRTHIAKTGYLPAEYIRGIFSTRTPSPFCAGSSLGAAIEKNFFYFFVTSFLFGFILDFIQNICSFNSLQVFSRYSSRLISLYFSRLKFWILCFSILYFDSFLLVEFYSHQFRLVSALSILCFNSSTLYLFNSSACYKQTSMLMQSLFYAYFGYFKAF